MARLLVVRHGQSTWNAEGRWQGQADPPLSEQGVAQAREAAVALVAVEAVWASDLRRAEHTAAILGEPHGVPVRVDARLRERHAGPWQGSTRDEIEAAWPGYLAGGRRPPGFEDDAAVLARALAVLGDIAAAVDADGGGDVVVVTHSGLLRVVVAHLGGVVEARLGNLSGWSVAKAGGRLRLEEPVRLGA